jgi:5S rRNA maturation endonuclease (ribonuclease M5)
MTLDEMKDTLTRLGVDYYSDRGYEIQAECPAHEERTGHKDRNPSFYINADTGAFFCFSCGWKGGLTTLINYKQGSVNAKDWLKEGEGLKLRLKRVLKPKERIQEQTYITESMLSAFTVPPADALKSRGLTLSAAVKYELLWDDRRKDWIIPIRDPITGSLLGWQEKGYQIRSFRNYPTGVHKSHSLFGYAQYSVGEMIVVESPLDVIRLASLGIQGGVATYGSIVSKAQFNLIRGADQLIFAMDNDDAGKKASMDLFHLAKSMEKEAWFFNYHNTDVKDIGGMSLNEIRYGLDNAKHIAHGLGVVL